MTTTKKTTSKKPYTGAKRGRKPGTPKTPGSGRRSKYTPEYGERLKDLMSEGLCLQEVCKELKISWGTFHTWKNKHAEFAQAVEEGKAKVIAWSIKHYRDHLISQADTKLWRMWMINVCGWRERHEHSTDSNKPLELNIRWLGDDDKP